MAANEDRLLNDLLTRILTDVANLELPPPEAEGTLALTPEIEQKADTLVKLCAFKLSTIIALMHTSLDQLQKTTPSSEEAQKRSLAKELFILKTLVKCCKYKWNFVKEQFKGIQGTVASATGKIRLQEKEERIQPNALDDRIARDLFLKVMHYSEKPPIVYQGEFDVATRECIQILSAFNYDNVIGNIIQHMLPHANIAEDEALSQINLIDSLHLNQKRLAELISKVVKASSSQNAYKKTSVQLAIASALHKAIWNWIDNYPVEFITLCQSGTRLGGNPDVLFDVFESWSSNNMKKIRLFWPVQTMLLILCPDLLIKIVRTEVKQDKKEVFLETLKKSLKGSKLADVAAISYVDICKASTFVSKADASALRYLVPSIEMELTDKLFNPKMPFKGPDGNVDENLMVDCLLSLFMLSPRKAMNSLFVLCMDAQSPAFFKRVLVKTLLRIATEEGTNLPWNPTIKDVYAVHASNVRNLFNEVKDSGKLLLQLRGSGKKAEKQLDDASIKFETLLRLIELFRADAVLALFSTQKGELDHIKALLTGICECCTQTALPELSHSACQTLLTLHKPENIKRWTVSGTVKAFWNISSAVVSKLSGVLIEQSDMSDEDVLFLITVLEQVLTYRNQFIENRHNPQPKRKTKTQRSQASIALEVSLLINLCNGSVDIVSKCANCFGLLCAEIDALRDHIDETDNVIVANYDAYKQLASTGVHATGRQAQQKTVRTVMRLVERQTAGNFSAWSEVLSRWQLHTKALIRNEEIALEPKEKEDEKDKGKRTGVRAKVKGQVKSQVKGGLQIKSEEGAKGSIGIPAALLAKKPAEVLQEWTNYLGFLCALGAVTVGQEVPVHETDKKGNVVAEKKVPALQHFISELMKLLVSEHLNVRETVKKTVGNAMSPAAYGVLFRHLELGTKQIFGDVGQIDFSEESILYVDQVISIMKLVLDQDHKSSDLTSLSNIEVLIMTLVKFVRQLTISVASLQTKHKLCGLIACTLAKSNMISFRNEYPFRTSIVENIMEWTSEFSSKESNFPPDTPPAVAKQMRQLTKELDVQVMQAISAVLRNLPLHGKDDEAKSACFSKFFTFFTNLLTRCKKNPESVLSQLPEATIESLSYLVTANIEHGLEYFVTMGYHQDYDTRSAFLKVLANILKEGTDFEMGGEELDKYYKLTELILQDANLDIVLTLCDVTQITEADQVAANLVRIFEANERVLDLIKAAISAEVRKTEQANTLFRLNSMATKLMVQYCKLIGVDYLRASVGPEIKNLIATPVQCECDPAKLPPGQDIEANQKTVIASAERFLDDIEKSIDICPAPFREICAYLKEAVGAKFPGAEHTAIAGFMFLRFLCPAIIAPDGFRVVTVQITDKDTRRSFVLVTKVLQNLANRVRFGNKEPFMLCMNAFIDQHIDRIRSMFDRYATVPEDVYQVEPYNFTDEEHEEDMGRLHFYLAGSKDKLAKAFSGEKGLFDRLTTILAQLGAPPEPKKTTSAAGARLGGSSKANVLFKEFMKRMANKNTDYIKAKNIFYHQGSTKNNVPVLYLVARNIKQDVDWEALIYFIFKTTQPFFAKSYSLVIDMTMISAENQIPLQWWTQTAKMIPDQASENLDAIYILHANQWFKKYSKRIVKFLGKATKKCEYFSSTHELCAVLSDKDLGLPEDTLNIAADIQSTFSPVVMVTQAGKKTDVEVRLSKDYIQIITMKPGPILATNAPLVNFIPISRVREVDANKDTEVIVKYDGNGVKATTFVSKSAGQLLQQMKASKDRYNLSRPSNSVSRSTAFRPSDVPGTLLNMALLNLTSSNHTLRVAAYNLLAALCSSFSFSLNTTLLGATDIGIARNCIHFVVGVSTDISRAEPSMTLEFLLEALHGIIKADKLSQVYVLEYIKPWLPNLAQFATISPDPESVEKRQKLKELINSLVALTIREAREILPDILSQIWCTMAQLNEAIDTVLECLCERALPSSNTSPLGTKNMDCFEDIMVALAIENPQRVSGKVVHLLLRALEDTSVNPVERLENHSNWVRIEVLIRWVMTLAFDNLLAVDQYLPELSHVIVMTFYDGDSMLRANIHALFMNVVHSTFSSRTCHEDKLQTLRFHIGEFHSLSSRLHFGVGSTKTNFSIYQSAMDRDNKLEKKMPISLVQNVTNSLFAVLSCCTRESSCVGTPYHSRWLALTCKAALTPNPALQPRAICALGALCQSQELVTEDIIEKLLVLLRNSLFNYSGAVGDLELSIIHALAGILPYLRPTSKYYKSMFWIAAALLQIHDKALYVAVLDLLSGVVKALYNNGFLKGEGLEAFCMRQRTGELKPLLDKLDVITGVSFNTNFSVAITAHLMKGLRLSKGKSAANNAITTILELCSEKKGVNMVGYFAALLPMKFDETASFRSIPSRQLLTRGSINALSGEAASTNMLFNRQMVPDDETAALVFTFIATVLRSSELEHEQLLAYKLLDEGVRYNSAPFAITFDSLAPKISQVLLSSQNPDILAIVHSISNFVFSLDNLSSRYDISFLKKMGFVGLPDCDQFHVAKKGALTQLVCSVLDHAMMK